MHEQRGNCIKPELRELEGKTVIRGYAAVFDSWSEDLGGFREIIRRGAFQNALNEKQDVRALFNHDSNLVLGRTGSGTMTLGEDERGLWYEIDPAGTAVADDLIVLLGRGDVSGSSFSFSVRAGGDRWGDDGAAATRELIDLDLYDVGPVTFPAYSATVSEAARRSVTDRSRDELRRYRLRVLRAGIGLEG